MDTYSTRTVQVHEKERELAREWERRHGRAPTSRELLHIASDATLRSRKGKDAGPVDWDALAQRWDATLGGELAGIASAVSNARGPDAHASEHYGGRAPTGPPTAQAQAQALVKGLILVSDQHPAWTRHDLLKHLALVMPPETRQMSPEEAHELLPGNAPPPCGYVRETPPRWLSTTSTAASEAPRRPGHRSGRPGLRRQLPGRPGCATDGCGLGPAAGSCPPGSAMTSSTSASSTAARRYESPTGPRPRPGIWSSAAARRTTWPTSPRPSMPLGRDGAGRTCFPGSSSPPVKDQLGAARGAAEDLLHAGCAYPPPLPNA
jgi:hypothetical protein